MNLRAMLARPGALAGRRVNPRLAGAGTIYWLRLETRRALLLDGRRGGGGVYNWQDVGGPHTMFSKGQTVRQNDRSTLLFERYCTLYVYTF